MPLALEVTHGHVHASNESYMSVDNYYLTMVPVVHFTGKRRETHWQEGDHLDALTTHAFEEVVLYIETTHIIIHQPHLYTLASLVYKHVAHKITQRVILYNI